MEGFFVWLIQWRSVYRGSRNKARDTRANIVGRQCWLGRHCRPTLSAVNVGCRFGGQPSVSKELCKEKIFCRYVVFLLSTKWRKTQNFSKETALAAIIDMLTSREELTQEKSITLDPWLDSTTSNDKCGKFHDIMSQLCWENGKNNK